MNNMDCKFGISNFVLKLIAIVTMTIDHVGAVLFPQIRELRIIGRLAFPIFAFLIVEGYFHTRDIKKYLLRLGIFAIISEPFFDIVLCGKWFDFTSQNVFVTLFLGLLMIYLCEMYKTSKYGWLIMVGFALAAAVTFCDYSAFGIFMIYSFYIFRGQLFSQFIVIVLINVLLMGGLQSYGAFAMIPIAFYNGKQGTKKLKYLFYLYYPLHMAVIGIIKHLM